jgi:hypothetical protein
MIFDRILGLGQLRAEVQQLAVRLQELEDEVDLESLEATHRTVLNTLRGLRRSIQAQEARTHPGKASEDPSSAEAVQQAILARRQRGILPGGRILPSG